MAKNSRTFLSVTTKDPSSIQNIVYNEAAGIEKNSDFGKKLLPLPDGAGGYTTDASTAKILPNKGRNISVYNNSSTVQAITVIEDNTVSALAAGVADSDGHVGIVCKPNDWTNIACGNYQWVISDSANLIVYLIDDNTYITQEIK